MSGHKTAKDGCCVPACLSAQWFLFFLSVYSFFQSMLTNGLVSASVSSIEKHFSLSSTKSGVIFAIYDVAVLCCVVPVSYVLSKRHKPRVLGMFFFLLGIGGVLFGLANFAQEYELRGENDTELCDNSLHPMDCPDSNGSAGYAMLLVGIIVMGISTAPLFTLGVVYLDENAPPQFMPVYIGVMLAANALGPAMGFILGGLSLSYYVNMNPTEEETDLEPEDTQWVGRWWMLFIVDGVLCLVCALPLAMFPSKLPEKSTPVPTSDKSDNHDDQPQIELPRTRAYSGYVVAKGGEEKGQEVGGELDFENENETGGVVEGDNGVKRRLSRASKSEDEGSMESSWSDLKEGVKVCLSNRVFLFCCLAGAGETFVVSAFAAFLAKLIETSFSLTSSLASIITGVIVVPGVAGGTYLGGWYVKRRSYTTKQMAHFLRGISCFTILTVFGFLIGCDSLDVAGVTHQYTPADASYAIPGGSGVQLSTTCNEDCGGCSLTQPFKPVCGSDGVTYYSSCHAGCDTEDEEGENFEGCVCLGTTASDGEVDFTAELGICETDCSALPIFLVNLFFAMLFTFLNAAPAQTVKIHSLPEKWRSLALSLDSIIFRVLGGIPGPLIMGALIDSTCEHWQDACEDVTTNAGRTCEVYKGRDMRLVFVCLGLVGKLWTAGCFAMADFSHAGRRSPDAKVVAEESFVGNEEEEELGTPSGGGAGSKYSALKEGQQGGELGGGEGSVEQREMERVGDAPQQ